MFVKKRGYLKKTLRLIQRKQCAYDGLFSPNAPSFCDCKYGFNNMPFGEQTGCPELRCIVELLTLMTDKEYAKIMLRGKHTLTG